MSTSLGQTVLFNDLTPARVVSLTNVAGTYYNGPNNNGVGATLTVAASSLTVDSVVLSVGDRVLLQNQTAALQNGVYIVELIASTVVLARAFDQQSLEQLKAGQFILIGAGTVNAGAAFCLVEPLPQNIGVDAFVYLSSPLSAAMGTAGAKAATNNALPDVVSSAGSGFTAGNFISAVDTAGSAQDSGFNVSNVLQHARVAMTAAQWNGMYAAPFLLVAAPGANKINVVEQITLGMTFVSAAYADGGVIGAQYGSTVHGAGSAASSTEAAADFFAGASTMFRLGSGVATGAPFANAANAGIYLSNLSGAFTTGDSTWIVDVYYRTVATV
jgi:hypothetical protein